MAGVVHCAIFLPIPFAMRLPCVCHALMNVRGPQFIATVVDKAVSGVRCVA
jgi:hypothetical protein